MGIKGFCIVKPIVPSIPTCLSLPSLIEIIFTYKQKQNTYFHYEMSDIFLTMLMKMTCLER